MGAASYDRALLNFRETINPQKIFGAFTGGALRLLPGN
jgi:hypothetical protein